MAARRSIVAFFADRIGRAHLSPSETLCPLTETCDQWRAGFDQHPPLDRGGNDQHHLDCEDKYDDKNTEFLAPLEKYERREFLLAKLALSQRL